MTKLEKVIKGIEACLQETPECCKACPYRVFYPNGCIIERNRDVLELLKKQTWRKFEFREPDADEKEYHPEWVKVLIGGPDDGDGILVSNGKYVWEDEFHVDDTCYLDSDADLEDCWWMPMPKPPKEGDEE